MKNLLNLKGVKTLSKMAQKSIMAGYVIPGGKCDGTSTACSDGEVCCGPPGGPYECQHSPCF